MNTGKVRNAKKINKLFSCNIVPHNSRFPLMERRSRSLANICGMRLLRIVDIL